MIPSNATQFSRKNTYLFQTKTGIYTFRWNVRSNGKHHQPQVSLKTRDYLEAIGMASKLARKLLDIPRPTVDQVKSVYV